MKSPARTCRLLPRYCGGIALVLVLLFTAPVVRTEEPSVFALTGGRVVPVSGAPLDKGIIVVRHGIIEAVGPDVPVPPDAAVIDATGLTIYPGLIDALSDVALPDPRPEPQAANPPQTPSFPRVQQSPQPAAPASAERQNLNSHIQAADILNLNSRKIEASRSAGITTALVAPRTGIIAGQSALVNLSGKNAGRMVVKTPVAMHVNLQTGGFRASGYPGSLMGVLAFVKQAFLDARHYDLAWSIYNEHAGTIRPEYDRGLQALLPVAKKQLPVVLPGDSPAQIHRVLELAEGYDLNAILSGGDEAGKIAAELKRRAIPLLLSVKFPERDRDPDPELEEEISVLRRRVEAPSNAAALAVAGVRFAFQSGDMTNPRDFIRNVARTVEAGLDKDVALRALTLTSAEILGVADRLGSIEKGKSANLILTTGDLFEPRTRVKIVFIDGWKFDITEPEPARTPETPVTRSRDLSGTWNMKVNAPQGPVEATMTLRQDGTDLSGTFSSPLGSTDLAGTVSGNYIRFQIKYSPEGGQPVFVTFTGTVQGNNFSGSADAGPLGKMEVSGSRNLNP